MESFCLLSWYVTIFLILQVLWFDLEHIHEVLHQNSKCKVMKLYIKVVISILFVIVKFVFLQQDSIENIQLHG